LELFLKFQGPNCQIVDCGSITERSKDLSAKFQGKYGITNKFCKANSRGFSSRVVDHGWVLGSLKLGLLSLRGSEAHLRLLGTERRGWRTHFEAHSGARDGEKAG
jgi:hypothetical protein